VSKKSRLAKPRWMRDFRERMEFFEIMESVFEEGCDCHVCERLRKLAHRWEGLFAIPGMPRKRVASYEEEER